MNIHHDPTTNASITRCASLAGDESVEVEGPGGHQPRSANGKLRDELLDAELFGTLLEARVLVERWRAAYDTARPHSALAHRPPAPEARLTRPPGSRPAGP